MSLLIIHISRTAPLCFFSLEIEALINKVVQATIAQIGEAGNVLSPFIRQQRMRAPH